MSTEHQASAEFGHEPDLSNLPEVEQTRLRHLFETQKYVVLATDHKGQPYTSLMAFSTTDDLRTFILMTERGRLKYENLMSNPRTSIMIDNRENLGSDLEETLAVTALGVATEISNEERDASRQLCLARHPGLRSFAESPKCAFIRIQVTSYVIVRQFQDVSQWRVSTES